MIQSTRFGLVGIVALALLTLVHQLRTQSYDWPQGIGYLLGVLPNALAAVAIPFVFMGILTDQKKAATAKKTRNLFYALVALSCAGLFGWEFVQQSSDHLVFDLNDLGATIIGAILSITLFKIIAPPHVTP